MSVCENMGISFVINEIFVGCSNISVEDLGIAIDWFNNMLLIYNILTGLFFVN